MKRQLKPTVSVAIPALNEEANIKASVLSVLHQHTPNYVLHAVYVLNDNSTDATEQIVTGLAKKYQEVKHIKRTQNEGKAMALNQAFELNTSDYLVVMDADCALATPDTLAAMVARMQKNKRLNAVGPRHIPVRNGSWMGQFAWISYLSFEDAVLKYNDGYNFYTSMTGQMLRKSFVDTLRYPKGTVSDQIYLYAKATELDPRAFELVREAKLWFTTVSTFHDWRVLAVRSTACDKSDAVSRFGTDILSRYSIPRSLLIAGQVKWFFKHPILVTGSLVMNVFVRFFPLKQTVVSDGMWIAATSSKQDLSISQVSS